jgi:hypothetical protein
VALSTCAYDKRDQEQRSYALSQKNLLSHNPVLKISPRVYTSVCGFVNGTQQETEITVRLQQFGFDNTHEPAVGEVAADARRSMLGTKVNLKKLMVRQCACKILFR